MYQGSFSHDPTWVLQGNQKSFLGHHFFRNDFESVMRIDKSFQGIAVEGKEANLIKVTNRWLAMLLTWLLVAFVCLFVAVVCLFKAEAKEANLRMAGNRWLAILSGGVMWLFRPFFTSSQIASERKRIMYRKNQFESMVKSQPRSKL